MKGKKAQTINTIIKLVIGLVVLGMLIYLGYKYILGTGEQLGDISGCEGQGGQCKASCAETERGMLGLGCKGTTRFCCLPQDTGT